VIEESRWSVDGASECLIPSGASAPFQVSLRSAAAVDRLTGAVEPHRAACLEFASNAGWWGLFEASDATWEARVKSAFRLLADSGFGGERSRGWGRSREPEFSSANTLFPGAEPDGSWWLLSLYSPDSADQVDWARGEYTVTTRAGWTDSPVSAGEKKQVRMIEEGSVLWASSLRGRAVDVAPEGCAHPVYRSGFALAVPMQKQTEPVVSLEETAVPAEETQAEEVGVSE
jgi:CRISPR type III-A-associated RAMP protein Csm4